MSDLKYSTCLWTGEQFRYFIANNLGPIFKKHGLDTEIWLGTINGPWTDYHPSLTTDYDQYANYVRSDSEALQYISSVSYQWDGKYVLQQTAESYSELRFMQSENECGDGTNTWEYAHYVFNLLRHYLNKGVSSYIYWNMVLEPKGRSSLGWTQNSMITVDPSTRSYTLNPEFYTMKHFSHYVQPGAFRLGTQGSFKGNSVAFRNPDNSKVVIVGNNMPKSRLFALKDGEYCWNAELAPHSFHTFVIK